MQLEIDTIAPAADSLAALCQLSLCMCAAFRVQSSPYC